MSINGDILVDKNSSGNPAFSKKVLANIESLESSSSATIMGTSIKVFIFLALTVLAASFGWRAASAETSTLFISLIACGIVAFAAAIITIFKPKFAAITGSIYALGQGFVLGAISQIYSTQYQGIVLQAIALTGALFFAALFVFSTGLIRVTDKFRTGVIIATLGIGIYYLVTFITSIFGFQMPLIYNTGTVGIVISAFIIFIATLNLILDFDLIQRLERDSAPKFFEWYGAFALMVTLIWLYFEVLRLLGNLKS
jgi:uncharacterized YccA/Bax inhibitor family protein